LLGKDRAQTAPARRKPLNAAANLLTLLIMSGLSGVVLTGS
jgi:hypothetical protein